MGLFERLLLELIRFLERGVRRKGVPLHVEFRRGKEFGHVIAFVEGHAFS